MKLSNVLTAGFASFATAAEQTCNAPVKNDAPTKKPMEVDGLAAQAMHNLELHYAENPYPNAERCTLENAAVRREWSTLQKAEKLHYIEAVQCLVKLPAKTPASIAAGAKSRYDDLVVTHIQQSLTVHGTGNFLTWHRYFTWAFEQMLKNECGFKGTQPYWNWGYWADNPLDSPLFDGSETSWSGDGAYIANRTDVCFPADDMCFIQLRPGTGGGCLTSGPFKDWKINMGPLATRLQPPGGIPPNPQADGLGYNPRCLSRDFSLQAANETRDDQVAALIRDHDSIGPFQTVFGGEFAQGLMGAHTGGHTTTGGDAGSDFMNAPADPVFWPQHAMVDRVYWTWQNLDIENRKLAFTGGTSGIGDGGPPASIDDILTLGDYVGQPNITIRSAMSTLGGPFCYVYA